MSVLFNNSKNESQQISKRELVNAEIDTVAIINGFLVSYLAPGPALCFSVTSEFQFVLWLKHQDLF